MQQMNLLDKKGRDPTAGFHHGNQESREAWRSLDRQRLSSLRKRILEFIKVSASGVTCEQIEYALELSHQTASARCTELKRFGLIVPYGSRPTKSGRLAAVYKIVDQEVD